MCVIFCTDHEKPVRPTPEMVEQAFNHNPAGAGIAWRRGGTVDESGQMQGGELCWAKGLELEAIQTLVKNAPLPFVCHFRIPTVGGKRQDLCHPFPIHKDAPLYLEGVTPGYVLFHNGHWHAWKDLIVRAAISGNGPIPDGEWSDSRAMAWIASICGIRVLEFVDEKVVAFSANDFEIFGNGWSKHEGVWVSNTSFTPIRAYSTGANGTNASSTYDRTYCIAHKCLRKDIDHTGWCPDHRPKTYSNSCRYANCNKFSDATGYCYEHRPKQVVEAVVVAKPSDPPEDDNRGNKTEQGGGPVVETPFRQTAQRTPIQLACQIYALAQSDFAAGRLSKNKWKKARKAWEKANERLSREYRNEVLTQQTLH